MKVIGTELYDKGFDSLTVEFLELLRGDMQNILISPSDANVLVNARTNSNLKKILDQFYWNLPDGIPSVWVMKLKGCKTVSRCSGPDFFKRIIVETTNMPINHYLCGGGKGIANNLKIVCNKWGNTNIVGTNSPPFKPLSEVEFKEFAKEIDSKNVQVLWVGLGAPKQLYFAKEIAKYTKVKAIITIGAAFDFHTGKVKKAPIWIQKMGMEWFYRMLQEPNRLFKRYLNVVPKFIFYNLLDFIRK